MEGRMPQGLIESQKNSKVESDIPARMDRLPWSKWHWLIVFALGTSWLLDGLQVTLAGSLAGILENRSGGLGLTDQQVTGSATIYLVGAVCGAMLFGYLTDRLGRRKLFLITLATYSLATLASAFAWNFWSFGLFRLITGLGIGGEYAAINSAVDELIPGRLRGTVDIVVNGTFWVGASFGCVASLYLLSGHGVAPNLGWRIAFGIGAILGGGVLLLRLRVPESPRWLMLRGREKDAQKIVAGIEEGIKKQKGDLPKPEDERLKITPRDHTPWSDIFRNMLGDNRQRSILGLVLMAAQAFFFNAVFFTYGLVVKKFFHVSDKEMPLHLLPFAIASFAGPLVLGKLFDKIGRKPMITATYGTAGLLLVAAAVPFATGTIGMRGFGIALSVVFFIASSASSAAYLTVSEIFPLEIRAFAIAVFYAIGTLLGGVSAPYLFGLLIASGNKSYVAIGYGVGALLMIIAAVCEFFIGVEAAGRSLESVSKPLQSE